MLQSIQESIAILKKKEMWYDNKTAIHQRLQKENINSNSVRPSSTSKTHDVLKDIKGHDTAKCETNKNKQTNKPNDMKS